MKWWWKCALAWLVFLIRQGKIVYQYINQWRPICEEGFQTFQREVLMILLQDNYYLGCCCQPMFNHIYMLHVRFRLFCSVDLINLYLWFFLFYQSFIYSFE